MENMFSGANRFNSDLSNWDVSKVTDMVGMFNFATQFNSDISNWDVSKVTRMGFMFSGAKQFNSDISNWDVSKVTYMNSMFNSATEFNSDISNWDVSNVTSMNYIFNNAIAFNGNVSNWDITYVTNMYGMFGGVKIPTENYDAILKEWSKLDLSYNVEFSVGYSNYCNSETERQKIIDDYGWVITDGGKDCSSLGIDDELLTEGLDLYPNPVNNLLIIDSKLPLTKVEIYSSLGQKVKEVNSNFNSISTDNLSKGIYIIKIYSENNKITKKLIKR